MLSAITAFLAAIPSMLSLFASVFTFIKYEEGIRAQKALADKLAAGIKKGATTGDTADVETILRTGNL